MNNESGSSWASSPTGLPFMKREGSSTQSPVKSAQRGMPDFGLPVVQSSAERLRSRLNPIQKHLPERPQRAGDDNSLRIKQRVDLAHDPAQSLSDLLQDFTNQFVARFESSCHLFEHQGAILSCKHGRESFANPFPDSRENRRNRR